MNITLEKNKLALPIGKGTKEDIEIFSEAIEKGINFYLSREDFQAINQEQAGNIYFLKWLSKCLVWKPAKGQDYLGSIFCFIPKSDLTLLDSFQESLDNILQDLLNHGAENCLNQHLSETAYFLSVLRKSLSPSVEKIAKDLRKSLLN